MLFLQEDLHAFYGVNFVSESVAAVLSGKHSIKINRSNA